VFFLFVCFSFYLLDWLVREVPQTQKYCKFSYSKKKETNFLLTVGRKCQIFYFNSLP